MLLRHGECSERLEVLTTVLLKIQVAYAMSTGKHLPGFRRKVMPSSSGSINPRRGKTDSPWMSNLKDEGPTFPQNIGNDLPPYTTSHPKYSTFFGKSVYLLLQRYTSYWNTIRLTRSGPDVSWFCYKRYWPTLAPLTEKHNFIWEL
jgi:hypothetical protein